jgi:hypothetical protein
MLAGREGHGGCRSASTVPWALAAQRTNATRCERYDTPMAVDHVLLVDPAEPDSVLDPLPDWAASGGSHYQRLRRSNSASWGG